jgi:FKBP-type peptidyl-prolyl cis-trans isomerase FklB
MTRSLSLLALALTISTCVTAAPPTAAKPVAPPKTALEKTSYSIGASVTKGFKANKVPLVADLLVRALTDVLNTKTLLMTDAECQQTMATFRADQQDPKEWSSKLSAAGAKVSAASAEAILKNKAGKLSYALGVTVGKQLSTLKIDVDQKMLAQGARDGMVAGKMLLTEEQMKASLDALTAELMKKQADDAKVAGEKNKTEGDAFLAKNKEDKDVVTLPSGLQYKILKAGDGKKPKAEETVEVNYRGTLIDGTEFDSSYKRGQTATFPVNGVIKGWTEALQLMPVGSKWQLFIPSELAYGPRGSGPVIGPNAVLVFEVELIAIK